MDANKLKVLEDIDYEIRRVCGNCCHFARDGRDKKAFGVCLAHEYKHLKHTDSDRHLSVHRDGHCETHTWKLKSVSIMHTFADLREQDSHG